MNGCQRISAALQGHMPDRVPVMLHNFLMAAREAGLTMAEYRRDPRAIARAFLLAVDKYDYDGIVVDVDTATLAGALGVPVDFPDDLPARTKGPRLHSLDQVTALDPPDIECYWGVQVWLEAATILARESGGEIFIRGNCDQAPFSLAAEMRSIEGWMTDITSEESRGLVRSLLDYTTEATLQFIGLMASTGVHMVSNGDSLAGPDMISPRMYRDLALPYEQRIAARAHDSALPYVLHICGKTDLILEDMLSSGADGLELDYKTNVRLARRVLEGRATFIGNIDPSGVLALGTASQVERSTLELLEVFRGTPRFILNAGCAVPAETPPENLRAMLEAARK